MVLTPCPAHTLTEKNRTLTRDDFIYGWKQDPESQLGRKEIKVRIHICREVKEEGRTERQTTERGTLRWIWFPITSGFCTGVGDTRRDSTSATHIFKSL